MALSPAHSHPWLCRATRGHPDNTGDRPAACSRFASSRALPSNVITAVPPRHITSTRACGSCACGEFSPAVAICPRRLILFTRAVHDISRKTRRFAHGAWRCWWKARHTLPLPAFRRAHHARRSRASRPSKRPHPAPSISRRPLHYASCFSASPTHCTARFTTLSASSRHPLHLRHPFHLRRSLHCVARFCRDTFSYILTYPRKSTAPGGNPPGAVKSSCIVLN